MTDCVDLIKAFSVSTDTKDLLSACLQSQATVHAGKIQAKAITLSGWLTLGAAFAALIGAVVAYWSALRQVSLNENEHKIKAFAYKTYLSDCANDLSAALDRTHFEAVGATMVYDQSQAALTEDPLLIIDADEFGSHNWERHSILTEKELYCARGLRMFLFGFNGSIEEFNKMAQTAYSGHSSKGLMDCLGRLNVTKEMGKEKVQELFGLLRRKPDLPKSIRDLKDMRMPVYFPSRSRRFGRLRRIFEFRNDRSERG